MQKYTYLHALDSGTMVVSSTHSQWGASGEVRARVPAYVGPKDLTSQVIFSPHADTAGSARSLLNAIASTAARVDLLEVNNRLIPKED